MDVVAGKGGNFFVVNRQVNNTIRNMLLKISADDFGKYNAYSTMKKISRLSCAEYAAQNGLHEDILENFSKLEEVIDAHATQDLMFFIESEDSRERTDSFDNNIVVNPANYNNGFLHAAPREVSGLITDSFQISEDIMPRMLKSIGISIERESLTHHVRWNNVTYKVDVIPEQRLFYRGKITNKSIVIVENRYLFQPEDWKLIQKIEQTFKKEKLKRQHSWFLKEKPDDVLLNELLQKLFKDKDLIRYTALHKAYRQIRNIRNDYIGLFIQKFHQFRNKILLDNRCLHPKSVALSPEDIYYLMVEDERSSHFASTIYRLGEYWKTGDWNMLRNLEPCFALLDDKNITERNNLLKNMDFVLNTKLKYWTENEISRRYPKFAQMLPEQEAKNSIAKGEDINHQEFLLQRSLFYSFYVYNPDTKKYDLLNLNKYIKINIPVNPFVQTNIINKAKYYLERKKTAKKFLLTKDGLTDALVRKAAIIFDAPRRLGTRRRK